MSTHLPHRTVVWIKALTVAWILVVLTTPHRVMFATEPDYASELPRIKPLSPKAALDSFRIQPGFRIEQVACEPMVTEFLITRRRMSISYPGQRPSHAITVAFTWALHRTSDTIEIKMTTAAPMKRELSIPDLDEAMSKAS